VWRAKRRKKPALLLVNVSFDIVRALEARLQAGFGERCWTTYSRPDDAEHPRMLIDNGAFFDAVVIDLKGLLSEDGSTFDVQRIFPDWIRKDLVDRSRVRAVTLLAPQAVWQSVQFIATSFRRDCVVTVRDTRAWKKPGVDPVPPLLAIMQPRQPAVRGINIHAFVKVLTEVFHP